MTSENHLLFDFKDILFVRFQCKKCGSVQSIDPNDWQKFPYACANCGHQWLQNMSAEERALQALNKALEELSKLDNDRFSIQLELRS